MNFRLNFFLVKKYPVIWKEQVVLVVEAAPTGDFFGHLDLPDKRIKIEPLHLGLKDQRMVTPVTFEQLNLQILTSGKPIC